jgi:hypothetical protein
MSTMRLVNRAEAADALGVSLTMVSAVKQAMGIAGHKFDLAHMRRWILDNPGFTICQVYPRKRKKSARCNHASRAGSGAGKCGVR